MKKIYVFLIFIFCLTQSQFGFSRDKEKLSKKFQDTLGIMIEKVEQVIDPDWFVERNDTGFSLVFCRTCQQEYLEYIRFGSTRLRDSLTTVLGYYPVRNDFLKINGQDSIWLRNIVSLVRAGYSSSNDSIDSYRNLHRGILEINVWFQKKWTTDKVTYISAINDSIRNCILSNHTKIIYNSFVDYRYYILEYYKDCYYEKTQPMRYLPYESFCYNYSVFIARDPNTVFKGVHFDPTNNLSEIYSDDNFLDPLIDRTLRIIALSLCVIDYKTINDYSPKNAHPFDKDNRRVTPELKSDIELR